MLTHTNTVPLRYICKLLKEEKTMAPSVLQNGGFVLGLIGAAALIAATAMNKWSVKDRQGDVVTSIYTYKGLWQDCETTTAGLTECRPLYGLLGFSGRTKLSYV